MYSSPAPARESPPAIEMFSSQQATPMKLQFLEDENGGPLSERSNRPERLSVKEIQGNQTKSATISKPHSDAPNAKLDSDVSVTKLKSWLKDFSKSHDAMAPQAGARPPVVVQRTTKLAVPVSKRQDVVIGKGPSMTPVRFKTRYENVQATDDGYASVKKLASWLADDPTKKKEVVGHVRKGINVISKSRKFDKELEDVILDEDEEEQQTVAATQTSIVRALGAQEEPSVSVADKKKWLQSAFPKKTDDDAQDDSETSTVVSVTDKKKWLANVFVKSGTSTANSCPPALTSTKASAKDMWRQKCSSLNNEKQDLGSKVASTEPAPKVSRVDSEESDEPEFKRTELAQEELAMRQKAVPQWKAPHSTPTVAVRSTHVVKHVGARNSVVAPTPIISSSTALQAAGAVKSLSTRPTPNLIAPLPTVATTSSGEEEGSEASLGFEAARKLLVQRGEKNGNPVMLSKVQVRKAKFEKWEQNLKKGTGEKGLLKPTWDQASPSKGRPSDSYKKSFVADIAPKKSLKDLP